MLNVGMVGVGCISGIYLENFTKTFKKIIGITPKEYRDKISNPF